MNKSALIFSILIFILMLTFIQPSIYPNGVISIGAGNNGLSLSSSLFSVYILPFEIITFLLLAAMLGAMYLGERGVSK